MDKVIPIMIDGVGYKEVPSRAPYSCDGCVAVAATGGLCLRLPACTGGDTIFIKAPKND